MIYSGEQRLLVLAQHLSECICNHALFEAMNLGFFGAVAKKLECREYFNPVALGGVELQFSVRGYSSFIFFG